MRNRYFYIMVAAAALVTATVASGQNAAPGAAAPSTGANPDFVVPRNTTIPLELRNTISSRTAYVGQAIYCQTIYPITVGNRIVIPVGAYVKGGVTQVVRPGRVKGRAQIGLRFESITLPDGTTRALRATLSGYAGNGKEGFHRDESKIEGESTKGRDAATVASTTGHGAVIGTIAGARSGNAGKGIGIGSAAGAAGGLIWVLATRGKDILLTPGTDLELILTSPLPLDPSDYDPPSRYTEGPALPHRDPGPSL